MHKPRILLAVGVSILVSALVVLARQTILQSIQVQSAPALLQDALMKMGGATNVSDVAMSGTARRIAGGDDESGTVSLKVLSSGATRLDFSFPSGPRMEFKSFASNVPTGAWSGPDAVVHPMVSHNLVNDWGWCPTFTLNTALANQNSNFVFVGSETRNGQSVLHVTTTQQFPNLTADVAALPQHLSQVDLFLDTSTHLPTSILYSIHPDKNALQDIPVELQFSDYRTINANVVPFHVQKFVNNTLAFDIQFQNVAWNSGISSAQIGAQ